MALRKMSLSKLLKLSHLLGTIHFIRLVEQSIQLHALNKRTLV